MRCPNNHHYKYTYLLKERILAFYSCHSLADLEIILN